VLTLTLMSFAVCHCSDHDRAILVLVEVFAIDRISHQEYEHSLTFTVLLLTVYNEHGAVCSQLICHYN